MFENLKNLKNLMGMMGRPDEVKAQFERIQNELARKRVEGEAGAGAVRVVADGKMQIVSVHLDRPMLATLAGDGSEADQQMIEELIAAATNDALAKTREVVQQEMGQLAGGLDLSGLEKLMGNEQPEDDTRGGGHGGSGVGNQR